MEINGQEFDDLMRKIAGIQSLIDRGATQGEIEAATGRMQALLTKHALSYEFVAERMPGAVRDSREIVCQKYDLGAKDMWRRMLIESIATVNFGRTLYDQGSTKTNIVADREQYRVIVAMYEFLAPVIEKLADLSYAADPYNRRFNARSWKTSFKLGAVTGVHESMKRSRAAAAADAANGSALVIVRDKELDAASRRFYPRQTIGRMQSSNGSAYERGKAEGRNIHLGGQVGSGSRGSLNG